jgi:hypothetical protein
MAKAAKHREIEISERDAARLKSKILDCYEAIESARGKFMNLARRERERMTTTYESMAALGVSQKAAKTNIKIIRAMAKIKGWIADLEAEESKMAQKLARAQGDKQQLMLWGDLPKAKKAKAKDDDKPDLKLVAAAE